MAGGVDPRAGRASVGALLDSWLSLRKVTVATKTYRSDEALKRLVPAPLLKCQVGSLTAREIATSFEQLLARELSEKSVTRYRASLSSFLGWCCREHYIGKNPITKEVSVPRSSRPATGMRPWTEAELKAAHQRWAKCNQRLADIMLVLGWTGLRWGEARALTVGDIQRVPSPGLWVAGNEPEGVARKTPKGRRGRRVPLADRVLPLVLEMTVGKTSTDLLLTTDRGSQLHRGAVVRTLRWSTTADGRRIHDLRHTAACLWLARGVDPGIVQHWMGHQSIATTNGYLHYLGTAADAAGLAKLNTPGHAGGTRRKEEAR